MMLVHTTFPDAATAKAVARELVEARFAACANVMAPCQSIYHWQDGIAEDPEVPVLFKTAIPLTDRLCARLTALHPYDVPVIEHWIAHAAPPAIAWVHASTGA